MVDPKEEFYLLFRHCGMTQAEVARQLGVGASAVSLYLNENNPTQPSEPVLRLFRSLLGVGQGDAASMPAPIAHINADDRALLDAVRPLSASQKHLLTRLASQIQPQDDVARVEYRTAPAAPALNDKLSSGELSSDLKARAAAAGYRATFGRNPPTPAPTGHTSPPVSPDRPAPSPRRSRRVPDHEKPSS